MAQVYRTAGDGGLFPDDERRQQELSLDARLWASKDDQPDIQAAMFERSRKSGMPLPLVQSEDNRKIGERPSPAGMDMTAMKALNRNPDTIPVMKDKLDAVNALGIAADRLGTDLGLSTAHAKKSIYRGEYSAERKRELEEAGYAATRNPDIYRRGGVAVEKPVLPKDVRGPEQERTYTAWRTAVAGVPGGDLMNLLDDLRDSSLGEESRRAVGWQAVKRLQNHLALSTYLTSAYPGWNEGTDDQLERTVTKAAAKLKLDISGIPLESFRSYGLLDSDLSGALNIFGAKDIYELATRRSPEELASVNPESELDLMLDAAKSIYGQIRNVQGRTFLAGTAEMTANMIPYMAELGILGATLGGSASASAAGAVARTAGGVAAKAAAKKGVLTGLKAIASSFGREGAGKAAGAVAGALARNAAYLPALAPGIAARARLDADFEPVYVAGPDGVKAVVSDGDVDAFYTEFVRGLWSRYLGNVTEELGAAVPFLKDLSGFVPQGLKRGLVGDFIRWSSQYAPDVHGKFLSRAASHMPLQGLVPELMEEHANRLFEYASTRASELTGLKALDLGADSPFLSLRENAEIAASIGLFSVGARGVQRALDRRGTAEEAARRTDLRNAAVDAMAESGMVNRSPAASEEILSDILGVGQDLEIDADDLAERMDESPDFYERLGVTREAVAVARENAVPVTLRETDVLIQSAADPESRKEGEKLFGMTRLNGETLKEVMDPARAEEAAREITERQNRILGYRIMMYDSMNEVIGKLKNVPEDAALYYARIFGTIVNYMDENSSKDVDIRKALENLSFWYQGKSETVRGRFHPVPGLENYMGEKMNRPYIGFTDIAQASTVLHEPYHFVDALATTIIEAGAALPALVESQKAINAWAEKEIRRRREAGEKKDEYYDKPVEVKVRAFLKYVMEGQAPEGLEVAFREYRKLLMAGVNSDFSWFELDDGIRAAYRSWLDSDGLAEDTPIESIVSSVSGYVPEAQEGTHTAGELAPFAEYLKKTEANLLGLSRAEKNAFASLAVKMKAQVSATARKTYVRTLEKAKKEWRKEARAAVAADPMYREWDNIRKSGGLNVAYVKSVVDARSLNLLRDRELLSKDRKDADQGLDVPQTAESLGYRSPSEMLVKYINADSRTKFMDAYVRSREAEFASKFRDSDAAMTAEATSAYVDMLAAKLAVKAGYAGYLAERAARKERAEREISKSSLRSVLNGHDEYREDGAAKSRTNIVEGDCRTLSGKVVTNMEAGDWKSAYLNSLDLLYSLDKARVIRRERKKAESDLRFFKRAYRSKKGSVEADELLALKELAYKFMLTDRPPEPVSGDTGKPGDPKAEQRERPSSSVYIEKFMKDRAAGPALFGDDSPVFSPLLTASGRTDLLDLEMADVRDIINFARMVYGEGRNSVLSGKKADHEDTHNKVVEAVETMTEGRRRDPKAISKDIGKVKAMRNAALKGGLLGANLELLSGICDGYGKYGKATTSYVADPLIEASLRMQGLQDRALRELQPLIGQLSDQLEGVNLSGLPDFHRMSSAEARAAESEAAGLPVAPEDTAPRKGDRTGSRVIYEEWTKERLAAACLNMGNAGNRRMLFESFGWGDVKLNQIAGRLPSGAWDTIQKIWDAVGKGELIQEARKTYLAENHYHMSEVAPDRFTVLTSDGVEKSMPGGYYPLMYAYRQKSGTMADGHQSERMFAKVGSSIDRLPSVLGAVVDLSVSSGLSRHITELADYAARRLPLKKAWAIVSDDRYRSAVEEYVSPVVYEMLSDKIKGMCTRERTDGMMDRALRWGHQVLVAQALGANVSTVLKQFSGLFVGADELGMDLVRAMLNSPLDNRRFAQEKSAVMRTRVESFDEAMKKEYLKFRDSTLDRMRDLYETAAFAATKGADVVVADTQWVAAYNKALGKGMDDAAAVMWADRFVARTQGSGLDVYRPVFMDSGLGRIMCPFMTGVNAQWNTVMSRLLQYRYGQITGAELAYSMACDMVMPALLTSAVVYVLKGGLSDDDRTQDKALQAFCRSLLSDPFGGMPLARDLADAIANYTVGRLRGEEVDSRWNRIFEVGALRSGEDLGQSFFEVARAVEDENWSRALYEAARSISAGFGMPVIDAYEKYVRLGRAYGMELPAPPTNAEIRRERKVK